MTTSNTPVGGASVELQRRIIRDAMKRLLDGEPVRFDGKLTVKSLAVEADVKRWVHTHKFPDLQDEFRARVSNQGELPANLQDAARIRDEQQERIKQLSHDLAIARETVKRYARVVQVLTLENDSLCSQIADSSEVVPLRKP